MTVRARVLLLALAASCKSSSTTNAAPAGKSVPAAPTPASPARTPAQASGHDDVAPLAVKTDAGGEVIGIGEPRMRLGDDSSLGALDLRGKPGLAAAEDAGAVTLWDLATGVVSARVEPLPENNPLTTSFGLSPDGAWLAVASAGKTRLLKQPFGKVENTIACSHAGAFSHDGKLLICEALRPQVWSLADVKVIAKAPDAAFPLAQSARAVGFSADDKSLYWATDNEIVRWDFAASGAMTTVYKSDIKISKVRFSPRGTHAFVSTRKPGSYKYAALLVDLTSGQTSAPSTAYDAAVSSDAKLLAFGDGNDVKVIEAATGKTVWSTHETRTVTRIAFANDADILGYVTDRELRIVDVPKGPRTYESPSRFAGWISDGVAAIARGGQLEQLALTGKQWTPTDGGALASKAPAGAPAWATWIAGVDIAAEPSARHDSAPDARAATPCMSKLRVWTAKGGEKSLAMTCAKGDDAVDPGWDVNGTNAVAVGLKSATVFDTTSGKKTGTIAVDHPRIDKPKFARSFWNMALSADGKYLALVSVGPQLPPGGDSDGDPGEDAMHADELRDRIDCEMDLSGECKLDYLLTVYSLTGAPALLRKQPVAKPTSLVFDHEGKHVIVGTATGEIDVLSPTGNDDPHVEKFHHGPITRLVPAPAGRWVFSEDAAGQQRLWPLP